MSDSHDQDSAHEGPIKTPKQLIWTVFASFVVPILIIILLVNYVAMGDKPAAGTQALDAEAVAKRIAPVARVAVAGKDNSALAVPVAAPTVAAVDLPGAEVYQQVCTVCHGAAVAGAPKTGDKAVWAARIAQGMDTLNKHAIEGYTGKAGVMPAKGGRVDLTDQSVINAVEHMVKLAQ